MRREANYAFEEGFFFFFSRDRPSFFFFLFISFLLFPSRYHRDSSRKVRVHRAKGSRNDRLEEETRFPAADRSANEPEGNL